MTVNAGRTRCWPTIGALKQGLEDARKHCRDGDIPGLLMQEDDLLPLIQAVEKREERLQKLRNLAQVSRDAAVLVKAILEPLP